MQYSNFDMKNNVHATLSTAISSVATTIQLTSWQGSRFWTTFPQIATIESFDENWKVMKREIVKITWRSGDNLTVVRAFAPCPGNDDANSQTQSAISFNADDTISLYIPKEIFDIIKKSLNDIYDNGTNNMRTDVVSWLQVEVNPWSVLVWSAYYDFAGWTITLTDNATNYLEIDEDGHLVNNTTTRNDQNTKLAIITTSSGSVTNIKDRRLWTVGGKIGGVNIHELTEKTEISQNDEIIIADSENIWNNKKVKASNIFRKYERRNLDIILVWWWWNGGWTSSYPNGWGGAWWVIIKTITQYVWDEIDIHIWQWWENNWNWWNSYIGDYEIVAFGGGAWWWNTQKWWTWWSGWWWWANGGAWWDIKTQNEFITQWFPWWSGCGWWWWAWQNWWNWNGGRYWWKWWDWIYVDLIWEYIAWWWWSASRDWWWWNWLWRDNYWWWWNSRIWWWWTGQNWVLIVSYTTTTDFDIEWSQETFQHWWKTVHIFTQSWTMRIV